MSGTRSRPHSARRRRTPVLSRWPAVVSSGSGTPRWSLARRLDDEDRRSTSRLLTRGGLKTTIFEHRRLNPRSSHQIFTAETGAILHLLSGKQNLASSAAPSRAAADAPTATGAEGRARSSAARLGPLCAAGAGGRFKVNETHKRNK